MLLLAVDWKGRADVVGGRKHTAMVDSLIAKGVAVYVVAEDVVDRGLEPASLLEGLEAIPRARIPQLFGRYDHIWHW